MEGIGIDIPEHFLICGICQNNMKSPKQLNCLHSFCGSCITDHFDNNRTHGDSPGQVACPICQTPLPGSAHAVEDTFASSLLATLSVYDATRTRGVQCARHPSEDLSKFCVSCDVVLCDRCMDSDGKHRQCDVDVISLSKINTLCKKKQQQVSDEVISTKSEVDNVCQELLKKQTEFTRSKDEIAKQIKDYFFQMRDESTRHILEQEQAILRDLDVKYGEENGAEMNKIAWCRSMLDRIDNQEELLARTSRVEDCSNNTGVALLQTLTEFTHQADRCKSAVVKYAPSDISIKFERNNEKRKDLMQIPFGKLEVLRSPGCVPSSPNRQVGDSLAEISPSAPEYFEPPPYSVCLDYIAESVTNRPLKYATQIAYFRSRVSSQEQAGYAVGLGWIDDRLVVVDRWNRKLKLFRFDGAFLHCMIFKDGDPWDVSVMKALPSSSSVQITCRHCLVTIPKCRVIMNIMIPMSDKMQLISNIQTATGYSCLAHDHITKTIVCGVCAPFGLPRVDIIKMNGTLFRSIAVDALQKPLFSFPRSVDVSEDGTIAVSDWNRNKIMFLRRDGLILGSYGGSLMCALKEPIGTSLDGMGNILVADKKAEMIHIVQLGGEGLGSLKMDTALSDPREINMSVEPEPRLAIAFGSGYVQVFALSDRETPTYSTDSGSRESFTGSHQRSLLGSGGGMETAL